MTRGACTKQVEIEPLRCQQGQSSEHVGSPRRTLEVCGGRTKWGSMPGLSTMAHCFTKGSPQLAGLRAGPDSVTYVRRQNANMNSWGPLWNRTSDERAEPGAGGPVCFSYPYACLLPSQLQLWDRAGQKEREGERSKGLFMLLKQLT